MVKSLLSGGSKNQGGGESEKRGGKTHRRSRDVKKKKGALP